MTSRFARCCCSACNAQHLSTSNTVTTARHNSCAVCYIAVATPVASSSSVDVTSFGFFLFSAVTRHCSPGRLWNLTTERLDSAYGWLPWPETLPPAQLGLLEDPCTPLNISAAGQVLLALLPNECSAAEIVRNAQVVFYISEVETNPVT